MESKDSCYGNGECRPIWITVADVGFYFGIGKTKCYQLIKEEKIVSREIKERGKKRGKRLVKFDSVDAFLEDLPS